ncbi:hypothetical protein ACWA7J_03155 [Leptothrix sp. BB-4]
MSDGLVPIGSWALTDECIGARLAGVFNMVPVEWPIGTSPSRTDGLVPFGSLDQTNESSTLDARSTVESSGLIACGHLAHPQVREEHFGVLVPHVREDGLHGALIEWSGICKSRSDEPGSAPIHSLALLRTRERA